ncbi:MAG: hypothetical protein LBS62_10340 [Clostridiales bacterium]|nr:hypothetical protein [Clostridiales bacterium]
MMKAAVKISDNFTIEDIRKLRDDYARRHTDESGHFDWNEATSEIEDGAAAVRAEIARIRSKRDLNSAYTTTYIRK